MRPFLCFSLSSSLWFEGNPQIDVFTTYVKPATYLPLGASVRSATSVEVGQGVTTNWADVFNVFATLAAQRNPEQQEKRENSQNDCPRDCQTAQVVLHN